MAEVIWNQLATGDWQAFSAGSSPTGFVHPLALRVLEEIGLPTRGLISKSVSEFAAEPMDLVVTVCDSASQACPLLPGAPPVKHWPFEDPANATGTDEERLAVFRQVRDQIKSRIGEFLKR